MVYIAIFIEYPTPFLREYFEKIFNLTYPKNRLAIFIHNQVKIINYYIIFFFILLNSSRLNIIKI
jgi:hypothetical protein